jgi:hypothetical protein
MANPSRSKLPRRLKRLWDMETPIRARAPAKAEKRIVFLWVMRDETRPDPMTVRKYPVVVIRNSVPAWTWEMERSASMAGSRGAMTILPMKLRKKMEARRRIGPIWERRVEPDSVGTRVRLFKSNSCH